jgi:hypothetical protein
MTMGRKARPNDPCPCGSGFKFKKCCGRPAGSPKLVAMVHTRAERVSATEKLDFFVDELWEEEEEEAFDEFWGRHLDREDELTRELLSLSRGVQETWFAFDYRFEDDSRIIDHFLEQAADLTPGERSYLSAMRGSSMHLYEVTDTVPGTSMTLRDLVEGTVVTVNERTGSRSISRHTCLAARVIPRGCSGGPEIEMALLHIPDFCRDSVLAAAKQEREEFFRDDPSGSLDDFYKELPPFFHDAWVSSIFEPAVPELANTDGEPMVVTRVSFHVDDDAALVRALDGAEAHGITMSEEGAWAWAGNNAAERLTSLGTMELEGETLALEANSVERAARGRALLERLAGSAIRHRATTHEDLRRRVMESVTARILGREDPNGTRRESSRPRLDPDVAEALVAEHYARHYRAWVDEPVPALDGRTPREASRLPALRSRLEELIHDLEGMYENALKDGVPAYDPSWMWEELDLDNEVGKSHPPPLAHERVAERVPGSAQMSHAVAERLRRDPAFEDASTVLGEDEFRADLELQRFLRLERGSANETGEEGAMAAPYLRLMVNFDLHRRKAFWVDAALSYMLEHTELDVAGGELRVPFPSFALALTDRHALSLGERLLARTKDDPLRGQILRVVTVYVTEARREEARVLEIVLALDALGADLPSLVRYEVPAGTEASVRSFLDLAAPPPTDADPPLPDANPVRGLLRLVINAILYATSAGVTPELRTAPPRAPRNSRSPLAPPCTSDSVYFLPGTIDIRSVRRFQELERAPEGRSMLSRFMVRGHWRRPQKGWTDQKLRWIEPYWKGPDMAAVIERAYRLKP